MRSRSPLFRCAPLVARTHVCDVLVHQLEFAGAAQDLDLFAAPVAFARAEERQPLAFTIDEVKNDAEDDPRWSGDAADRMRDQA